MTDCVCLDANVLIKAFIPEEGRDRAVMLLKWVRDSEAEIVAPAFMQAEVLSSIRRKVAHRQITAEEGEQAARLVLSLEVREVSGTRMYERAWELSGQLGMVTIYDAVYLAVAEAQNAEFWTADRKLYDQAKVFSWEWPGPKLL